MPGKEITKTVVSLFGRCNNCRLLTLVLTMKYDVIVCGGGVVGLWTANHLAEQNKKVLLLEQFPFPHSQGSSHGSSRITRYSYITVHHCRMMSDAFELWRKLEDSQKTKIFINCGLLTISSQEHHSLLTKSLDDISLEYKKLSGSEIATKFPGIADLGLPGVLEKTGGVLKANLCLESLQKNLLSLGGNMLDERKVELIKPINGELVEVVTNNGTYFSKSVVLTCGSWINKVLKPLNLQLPIKAYRVSVNYWPTEQPAVYDISNFPALIMHDHASDRHIYSTPVLEYPGLIKVCLSESVEVDPDEPDCFDREKVGEQRKKLKSIISACFPKLTADPIRQETCLLTKSPDEDFILDYHPQHRNIIIGAAMSGHGFKIAPVVGKILSDLAIENSPQYDLKPFSLNRFK